MNVFCLSNESFWDVFEKILIDMGFSFINPVVLSKFLIDKIQKMIVCG